MCDKGKNKLFESLRKFLENSMLFYGNCLNVG